MILLAGLTSELQLWPNWAIGTVKLNGAETVDTCMVLLFVVFSVLIYTRHYTAGKCLSVSAIDCSRGRLIIGGKGRAREQANPNIDGESWCECVIECAMRPVEW